MGIMVLVSFVSLVLMLWSGGRLALAYPSGQTARSLESSRQNSVISYSLYLPLVFVEPPVILCDNKVYSGYTKSPLILQTELDKNPAVQKIIRNCTFKNSTQPGIVLNDAKNVLIEGNTFENIRTNVAGADVNGIIIRCRGNCNIDNIVIRTNSFKDIGSDGIQMGEAGRNIKNVVIENNTFQGSESVGENGIDIKGVEGPIYVRGNSLSGFRPCQAGQDCSGGNGPAMTVHPGASSGKPANIIIEGNSFYNSNYGLVILEASTVIVRNNQIFNNLVAGLRITDSYNVTVSGNSFWGNPEKMQIKGCTNCTVE
jgi:parallel beta-helix repeat protein